MGYPYMPPQPYMGVPPHMMPLGLHPQYFNQPAHEGRAASKPAEEEQRELNKYNAKSSEEFPREKSAERHTRSFNRMELKHEEELRAIQLEIEFLRHKRMLEDLRQDIENERVIKSKEIEHNQMLLEQKQQLQAIKLRQVLAKEQRLLELQGGSSQVTSTRNCHNFTRNYKL